MGAPLVHPVPTHAARHRRRPPNLAGCQRFSIGVADSLLCEPARDRAGNGDELIGRCGHALSYGLRDTASASGRVARPGHVAKQGFEVAHRPCPARQVAGRARQVWGRTMPPTPTVEVPGTAAQTAKYGPTRDPD